MTEPQVWTLIGVFAAVMFAMLTVMIGGLTLVSTSLARVIRSEVGRLEARFDHLDRDVQALTDRVWRTDRDS
ncbi:hypothetical protein [uncultured Microbacterium sp.]|uniref:hypothetical protein n=1 Tax=uncultured Microbacterium sp. TaxID=191216 RepID=UPI0035CC1762